ncbi:hypothetical protein CCACVL1_07648 [Corchorus capsularis]|uniref:Uncharacterized protein n=1 Tax=Corchorus capsularis TaxID=210143 RepID=A0A1R3J4K5_COCAP|nr:hypothetical protein CCACVL1_07648 [Corchorus capsularis]
MEGKAKKGKIGGKTQARRKEKSPEIQVTETGYKPVERKLELVP